MDPKDIPLGWIDGCPDKDSGKEWFIAETTHGDRTVLKSLPEEYTYDYRTADNTYIKADKIKRWMPFPDSQYFSDDLARRLDEVTAKRDALANRLHTEELWAKKHADLAHKNEIRALNAEAERDRWKADYVVMAGLLAALDRDAVLGERDEG